MKINWKGNIIAVGCIGLVAGTYLYVNPIQTQITPAEKAIHDRTERDLSYATAKVADISKDDNNGIIDTSYLKTPVETEDDTKNDAPKQDEIKINDPYQKVLQVLGQPDDKVVTKDSTGSSELWTYGNKDIFFIDGFVDSITVIK